MGRTAAHTALRARVDQDAKFLATLRDTGNVTAACMVSGYDRSHIYQRRKTDTAFYTAWEAAIEVSVDKLEIVARNRAIEGHAKDVYYKGDVVGQIHEPSDRLMELLLKAHRPEKFNPVQKLEHSGGVSVAVVQFAAPQGKVIEHQARGSGSEEIGGASSEGGTPKLAAAENDEPSSTGIFIENFSEQSPTESKEIDDGLT